MQNKRRGKCRHCKEFYQKDARNFWHQSYCPKPEYREVSKTESQRRWLEKSENRNYFRGFENVERVRAWRKKHPKYWQRYKRDSSDALQDVLTVQPVETQEVKKSLDLSALQEVLLMQHPLVVGLISMVTGDALQENIEQTTRGLLSRGQQILGMMPRIHHPG